nr:NAC domain containing protein 50-like isoform X2 [Quercus suber]
MEKLSLDHLPPGVRFSPKDKEVIELYLKKKIAGNDKDTWFIPEIEFYKDEPWDLPIKSGIATEDQEWFFFTGQSLKHQKDNQKKRKRGQKQELVNRQTKAGFWKSTGPDREIESGESLIGMKKTLVFHIGSNKKEEKAIRTNWVMHEYRTTQKEFDGKHPGQKALVLCRLFYNEEKSNKGGPAESKPARLAKKKSKPALAPVCPVLEVQAENHQTSNQSCCDEISAQMMSDVTELVQCNNDNDLCTQTSGVGFSEEDIELLMRVFYVPSEDSPSSLPLITPDVSTPITVKSSHKETSLAPASQALPEQAENHPIDWRTRFDNAAPLACNNDYNADAAENQVAEVNTTEVDWDLDIDEALEMFDITPPGPLDCNLFFPSTLNSATPAVSYPTTAEASLEEAQSLLAPASVSPKLVSEANNCSMSFRCSPAENSDRITSSTVFASTSNMLSPLHSQVSPGLLKSGSYLGSEGGSSDQIIGSD